MISIHAPTRGATSLQLATIHRFFISIHAPTRGATNITSAYVTTTKFQSTLPREERLFSHIVKCCIYKISIHAPTRGATLQSFLQSYLQHISIHAPTRGATFSFPAIKAPIVFQSTLPREERLSGSAA